MVMNLFKVVLMSSLMLITIAILATKAYPLQYGQEIMQRAELYKNVRELHPLNGNRSPEIDSFLSYLGLPVGLSYCISYDIYVIGKTYESHGKHCPVPKIGRVSTFVKTVMKDKYAYRVINPRDVELGIVKLKPGMIATWSHGKKLQLVNGTKQDVYDWAGHGEIVATQDTKTVFHTWGANTTGVDDINAQREQHSGQTGPVGGVWYKKRNVSKQAAFATEAFIDYN